MKMPWERRLKDLSILLRNCASTYFDPDLFRMNTNQFLQTSRTVTFIIQKNKSSINDFESWYKNNVIDPWSSDVVMKWAKDSRNIIEKRGDLEINSHLEVSLVYSYLDKEDLTINVGKRELLQYGVKKLVRFAQKNLPSGISQDTVLKISRTWITTGLSDWELLHALTYVYGKQYETHIKLCEHLKTVPTEGLLDPVDASSIRETALDPKYLKLKNFTDYSSKRKRVKLDPNYKPPIELESIFNGLRENTKKINSLNTALNHFLKFAKAVYNHDKYHIQMLHMFDKNWKIIDQVSTVFEDQAEKYIFWRSVGERVKSQNTHAVVWISEIWHRNIKGYPQKPINKLQITGEGLMVAALDSSGHFKQGTWKIIRDSNENPTLLEEPSFTDETDGHAPYFFAPIGKAMGGKAADLFINAQPNDS